MSIFQYQELKTQFLDQQSTTVAVLEGIMLKEVKDFNQQIVLKMQAKQVQ